MDQVVQLKTSVGNYKHIVATREISIAADVADETIEQLVGYYFFFLKKIENQS